MRISDWSSDVCSSDLRALPAYTGQPAHATVLGARGGGALALPDDFPDDIYLPADYRINSLMDRGTLRVVSLQAPGQVSALFRSEEHTSELQSLMRISYAVLCLKKKNNTITHTINQI